MCTRQIKMFTNASVISKVHSQRLYQYFPCGFCSECIRQKRSEWRVRSYYEARRCFDAGEDSFILWDTLTYDDDHIKWFHDIWHPALYNPWDFFAFSRDDVKKFFKRLRINLTRSGYDVKDNLRYLLTSEYGGNGTHRSHYHVIFFSTVPGLKPLELSRFISKSWTCGFTDGVSPSDDDKDRCKFCPVQKFCNGYCLYHKPEYVLSNRVIHRDGIYKAVNYVTKYITKDLASYGKLFRRVFMSFSLHHENKNWQMHEDKRLEFRRFKNSVLPFHVQSLGFGAYALKCCNQRELIEQNCLSMPTSTKDVVISIPLPQYYRKKLLFHQYRLGDSVVLKPNPDYYAFKSKLLLRSINNLSCKIMAVLPDLHPNMALAAAKYHLVDEGVYRPFWFQGSSVAQSVCELDTWTLNKDCQLWYQDSFVQRIGLDVVEQCPRIRANHHRIRVPRKRFRKHREYIYGLRRKFIRDGSRLLSHNEFVSSLPTYSVCYNSQYQKIIDDFQSLLFKIGVNVNWYDTLKAARVLHYKEIGMLK